MIQEGGASGGFSAPWASPVCSLEEEEGCRQEEGVVCRGSQEPHVVLWCSKKTCTFSGASEKSVTRAGSEGQGGKKE